MLKYEIGKLITGSLSLMLLFGCSDSSKTSTSSSSSSSSSASSSSSSSSSSTGTAFKWGTNEDLYAVDALMKVDITMPTDDWNSMRYDGPQISEWNTACAFEGYPYYKATVTINGETTEQVDIRKKGWIGSVTASRPSVKLNFGRGEENKGNTFHDHKRITLNNNKQDSSNIKQCLSYSLFNQAGVRAPRCNFASVSIQGNDLGIYSHVEAIKKPFLLRAFGNDDGNLYEMQRDGEFDATHISFFQLKTNETENDQSDLQAVLTAMELPDNEVLQALNQVLDVAQFTTFAAMEALLGHTDGYTGYQNNTYLYHNATDDRLHFIPWGTDQTFSKRHIHPDGPIPFSVMLGSKLIQRLWLIDDFRSAYVTEMRALLDTVWNEENIGTEINRLSQLLNITQNQTSSIVSFVNERRQLIERELDGEASTEWDWPLLPDVTSCPTTSPISGAFDIAIGPDNNDNTFNLIYNDMEFSQDGGESGIQDRGRSYGVDFNGVSSTGSSLYVGFNIPKEFWALGSIPLHSIETIGYGRFTDEEGEFIEFGLLSDGGLNLTSVSTVSGSIVSGTFEAVVIDAETSDED